MSKNNEYILEKIDKQTSHSVHLSRTMMYKEIDLLISYMNDSEFDPPKIKKAIIEENCLSKKTLNNRKISFERLRSLYILDKESYIFQSFLYYWNCDTDGRRLLAFLLAYFRDFYVRISIPFILDIPYGEILSVEYLIEKLRYKTYENITEKTLQSLVRNLRSTFSQSGHLTGKVKKTRINPSLSSGAISFALLLGYLEGMRGELLFQSEYMKSIECSPERGYNFAYDASSRGWLDFKKAGNIVEVSFSNFTKQKRNKS